MIQHDRRIDMVPVDSVAYPKGNSYMVPVASTKDMRSRVHHKSTVLRPSDLTDTAGKSASDPPWSGVADPPEYPCRNVAPSRKAPWSRRGIHLMTRLEITAEEQRLYDTSNARRTMERVANIYNTSSSLRSP